MMDESQLGTPMGLLSGRSRSCPVNIIQSVLAPLMCVKGAGWMMASLSILPGANVRPSHLVMLLQWTFHARPGVSRCSARSCMHACVCGDQMPGHSLPGINTL